MDISHAKENGRSQRPVRGESRGQSRSTSSGHMISRDGQRVIQVEELHEHNKILRQQVQVSLKVTYISRIQIIAAIASLHTHNIINMYVGGSI